MSLSITGQNSELGRLLAQRSTRGSVHLNLAGQQANTLLHDGHAWAGFARSARAGVTRALRSDARLIVHASCAFVLGEPKKDPLRSIAQTVLECEQRILDGPVAACVVRLGYLYGPGSRDLRAYRKAFRLHRPYWAGPRKAGQFHLHHDDAVRALLAAAKTANAGRTLYATAGPAVPFMRFMDDFAHRIGTRFPLHAPRIAAPMFRLVVREEHMQQVALVMPAGAPAPQVPGWKPVYAEHDDGLDQIIEAWAG